MASKKFILMVCALVLLSIAPGLAQAALAPSGAGAGDAVRAQLIADATSVAPGRPFRLGVRFTMQPGWHIYWHDAGDAGKPTEITWGLPAGFKAGPLLWPKPAQFEAAGLASMGYEREVVLYATVTPPAEAPDKKPYQFSAHVEWVACKESCIQGLADLSLSLPPGPGAPSPDAKAFDPAAQAAPQANANVRAEARTPNTLQTQADNEGGGRTSHVFSFYNPAADPRARAHDPLWLLLLKAFLGGLILNIMPCVLPVLSLKILGFVNQAGQSRGASLRLGLAYTAGVLASFAVLAGMLVAVRAAGRVVGQGIQFQEPRFVIVMAGLILALSLSLLGVYTIELPGAALGRMDRLARREGAGGAFLSGILSTALATPCTAPFLGTALVYAFARPPAVIFLFFVVIGLGLAAPYLLLSANPAWLRFVPRPGRWMIIFEQLMGFVMLAFTIWLLSDLGTLLGPGGVIQALLFLLTIAVACWGLGWAAQSGLTRPKWRLVLVAALLVATAGYFFFPERYLRNNIPALREAPPVTVATLDNGITSGTLMPQIEWQPFSVARVEQLVKAGRTVFVDFTADWCWTCKVNERTTLESARVREAFARYNVAPVKADWTAQDETIGRALSELGGSGVPFYVIFPAGRADRPKILPTILTPEIVERSLKE